MNIDAIVDTYISRIRPHAEAELSWFHKLPSLEVAIETAALAINSNGKRYHHQRRLKRVTLESARLALMANSKAIAQSRNFHELFSLIDAVLQPISGIGELYVYDTSLRIGAYLKLLPLRVYLHAGTRDGVRALGLDYKVNELDPKSLHDELQRLEPHEIEDVLCIFKNYLEPIDLEEIHQRSWCA